MGHQFLLNHFSGSRRLNLRADTGTKGCSALLPIHTFASLFSKSNKRLYPFNSTRYQRLFHLAGIRFPRFYILCQPPAPLTRRPAAATAAIAAFHLLSNFFLPQPSNVSFRPYAGICLGNLCIYICIIHRFLRHITPLKTIFYGR